MNYQPQNCRVCLKNVKNSYNLTELMTTDETFNISYESAFVECTGFVVESSEPQKICKFCAGELKIAFSFREKCKKTQDELGNCFKIEEIQIKSEFNDEGYELQCLQNVEISQAKPTKTNQQNKQKKSKTLPSNKRKQKQTTKNTERYFCDLCASSYTLRKHLKSHYDLKHSDQKRYQCPRCDSHHSIQLLKLHLQYKHRVNPENIDLEVEKSDAETNDRYKCDLCQKLYMKREYLKDHYSAKHADEEMHQCPYCDYKNALQMFNLHLLFKHKMKTKSNIQYIMIGKSSDTSLTHNASENELKCSKRNENDDERENSENVTNNSNQDISLDQPSCPRIKCDICENTYTKKGHLKDHYITKHAGQETCECEYCGERCFSQYLESHIFYCKMRPKSVIVSLPRNQRPLTLCPVCGELKSKEHISKHVSGKQKENVIYICDLCGKTIKCKNTLYQHMQEKHLKILYECHYCYMKLSRKADRVHHERKFHPEIKGVLKCPSCDYTALKLMTTDENLHISYESAFVECTGFVVEPSEPQKICKFCAGELKIAFSFREKCKKTQGELGNCFKIEEIQIKSEFNDEGYELQCLQNVEISLAKPAKKSKTLPSNQRKQKQTTQNTERYFCDLCGSSYKFRRHLKDHYDLKHRDEKKFQCPQCDSQQTTQLLKLHLKHQHRANPEDYDLNIEPLTVKKNGEKSEEETNNRYKCDLCQKLYKRREHLKDHYSAKHPDEELHQCPYCDYKNALQMINLHLLFKHKMKTKANIQYVMKGKSSDTLLTQNALEDELKCPKRNEKDIKRENSENVTNNSNQDISMDLPRIKCDICENTYKNKGHLKDHYIAKHAGQETCECEYCGERCFSQYLESHIYYCKMRPKSVIVSLPRTQRPLTLCPVCGELRSKEHISKHVRGKQKEEIYMCDLCGKTIKCRKTLIEHMKEKHLKILYECRYCYMKLPSKNTRVRHERKFHPEITGLLKCPSCDYTAARCLSSQWNNNASNHQWVHLSGLPLCVPWLHLTAYLRPPGFVGTLLSSQMQA
uniref:CSON001760 protein n=1 Tax=Culicoides sonorensis TaxID=179676 RepID=A0A336LW58_CULSO